MIIEEIKLLLDLFEAKTPDKDSNRLVWKFCNEKHRWIKAHGLHSTLRDRNMKAIKQGDKVKEAQYCFEEVVAKTLFNLTRSSAPFDPDSPYWVIKNALSLANALEIPSEKVVEIIT
ncbi:MULTISPECIES: hypothetical protein [unclassified Neptuniibacter]|uniref:hypothetical protein n=1 Tax=unclassified Neptuniibacter TaxID=2630693 RepID=UPI0025F9741F|nr:MULTISPECIES: hypothetical protein [unclassified Neptuniibacter]|tara:strand:+ start:20 stop:370 length:351 start_codon:yes stop_codon:yes gene_type:complete